MDSEETTLSIGDLSAQTGIPPATLRMWEDRHGYPRPRRLPSGHRRYPVDAVEGVLAVAQERRNGLPLQLAIERVLATPARERESIFAGLRRSRLGLRTQRVSKRALTAISRAIEDEYAASGGGGLVAGSFQRVTFYRAAERRWNELARIAQASFALGDFPRTTTPENGPARVRTSREHPASREWAVICDAPAFSACLVGLELAAGGVAGDGSRRFEATWSFDSTTVRTAAELAAAIASERAPRLTGPVRRALRHEPGLVDPRLALAGSERMVEYLARVASRSR
jgi:DICT domain-containing protein